MAWAGSTQGLQTCTHPAPGRGLALPRQPWDTDFPFLLGPIAGTTFKFPPTASPQVLWIFHPIFSKPALLLAELAAAVLPEDPSGGEAGVHAHLPAGLGASAVWPCARQGADASRTWGHLCIPALAGGKGRWQSGQKAFLHPAFPRQDGNFPVTQGSCPDKSTGCCWPLEELECSTHTGHSVFPCSWLSPDLSVPAEQSSHPPPVPLQDQPPSSCPSRFSANPRYNS